MTARRLLAAPAALVLAIAAASCSPDEPGPSAAPPEVSVSDGGGAEADPSDGGGEIEPRTDVDPPDPADYPGMNENTPEGAQQAYRYFWAHQIYAYQTGDVGELEELGSSSCTECVEQIDTHGDNLASDALWEDASILEAEPPELVEDEVVLEEEFAVYYTFTVSPFSQSDRNSGESIKHPATTYITVGILERHADKWVVAEFSIEEE